MNRFLAVMALMVTTTLTASYQKIEDQCSLKILTPDLAQVKTAKIRLSNGLEAFLISDPGTHQSCAALAVDAGSWQDPDEYPGMAHFLEHMLFMGTKAYPKEAEYKQYISDHGGSWNAYTASNRTVYGFSINNEFLNEGLDRFAHFFIDPLFLQNSVGRELLAVDQEHAKNIEHDGWRCYMIMKETGNPEHPNARFSTGNKATLEGIPQSALQNWYENHYSANRMHLVVISPMSTEEMIKQVSAKFSPVVNRKLPDPVYPHQLFSKQQLGHWLYVKPIKDLKSLSMVWQLPLEVALDRETHASSLIAYALSNGAQNGLSEELKREKLIEGVSISIDRLSHECVLMSIDFALTEHGAKHTETVVERAFQTLSRLKETGIPRYIFDEHQKLRLMRYEYQSRNEAFSMALNTAGELTEEKIETYPQKLVLATRFDPDQISKILNSMTPEECLYMVSADPKLTGVEPTSREKWMDAAYRLKDISTEQLTTWAKAAPHPHIDLPAPNPYFPESMALVQTENPEQKTPVEVVNDDLGHLYFLQDHKYQVPETAAIFAIKTPEMDGSSRSRVLFDLYIRALEEKLCSTLFFASQAGLSLSTSQNDDDFVLSIAGYSEKAPLFLKTVFESLHDVSPTAAQFEIYKQSLLSSYDNASKELPLRQGIQLLNSVIFNNNPTPQERLQALQHVTYEQFLSFANQVLRKAYLEGMIYGNLTQADAAQIWAYYKTAVEPAAFPKEQHYKKAVFVPSEGQGPFMIVQSTERQGNGTLLLLHEASFSMENRATQQILSAALKDDFFDTLRSKQQTGYIATSWDLEIEEQLFQMFGVQSITHGPQELLARFELFLEEFCRETQDKVPSDRFETLKATLIKELEMPPENLSGKTSQLYHLAFEKKGDFNWLQKRIATVKALSYDQFTKTARTFLSRHNHGRLAVLMEGVLPAHNQFQYEIVSEEQIRDKGSYISAR